jgi:polysaccharide biosynthesis protein PslA
VSKSAHVADLTADLVCEAEPAKAVRTRHKKRISLQQCVAEFAILDCALLFLLGVIALSFAAGSAGPAVFLPGSTRELEVILMGVVGFLASQKAVRGYRSHHAFEYDRSIVRLVLALLLTFSFLIILGAAAKVTHDYSRLWFFSWMAASLALLPALRFVMLRRFHRMLASGGFVFQALSVGVRCEALTQEEIGEHSRGLSVSAPAIGMWDLDDITSLAREVRERGIDEVYITVPWSLAPDVLQRIKAQRYLSANVYVVPMVAGLQADLVAATKHGDNLLLQTINRPLQGWNFWLKRRFDILVALVALVVLGPVMVLVAAAIALESRGPVLFRQTRQGFNGVEFELLKFRSMYVEASDALSEKQTSARDPRVTRVGRFIRRTSLDELPQLFNVLQGHMAVVGPRPHALRTSAEGKLLADAASDYAWRHRVRPGLTGWAQVNGMRGEINSIEKLRKRLQYDMEYIDTWSIGFDLVILMRTLWLVFRDPNAY